LAFIPPFSGGLLKKAEISAIYAMEFADVHGFADVSGYLPGYKAASLPA
jgi:hypothetical protein